MEFGASQMPIEEALIYGGPPFGIGARMKALMRQSPFRDHLASLTLQAEDAPQPTNRVDLDPAVVDLDGNPVPRVTYANHKWELATRDFYSPKMLDILGAAGASHGFIAPIDTVSTSRHIMGTLRFGADPKTSVCNADGQFHDVGNLFAADGSLFPTSSGFNPTLTITALSMRVAAALVNPSSPLSALPDGP